MREFQRMMSDCRDGRIDLILVKSISRLGRNTVQFLEACDEFKQLHIDVYFELEQIHISDSHAVKALTILAAFYQNESESKSFSIRWGITTRFQNGSSGFANRKCYGYAKGDEGTLVPVPKEAEIVRQIFQWRIEGESLREIAKALSDAGIPAPRGGTVWHIETIRKMLKNEKYVGNVLFQKTYVADFFTGKQKENKGEYTQYLLTGHHEAIIAPPKTELLTQEK